MHMARTTVTMPDDVLAAVHALVEAGHAPSVSAFVASATAAHVDAARSLAAFRAFTGVVPTAEETAEAARLFGDDAVSDRRAS
jgi:Arc/MetJ-type ribon-helix-helix transcriptional regulator